MNRKLSVKDYLFFIIMITVFYTIAITLWLVLDSIFYLVNFTIIGTSLALGIGLWPVLFKKIGILRYIHFIISSLSIIILFFLINHTLYSIAGVVNLTGVAIPEIIKQYNNIFEIPEFWWFLIGNIIYFLTGIILAAILKDNRAFCKYLCPITVFLKIGSKFSIMKIKGDPDTCTECKACSRSCPMDINVHQYTKNRMRVTSSECILCMNCINVCPENTLKITNKLDKKYREFIRYKE